MLPGLFLDINLDRTKNDENTGAWLWPFSYEPLTDGTIKAAVKLVLEKGEPYTHPTYGPISEWDVSNVTDMKALFAGAEASDSEDGSSSVAAKNGISLTTLHISTNGSTDGPVNLDKQLGINNGIKRARDEMLSLLNAASLKLGRLSKEYQHLVNDIVDNLGRPLMFLDLNHYVLHQLRALLKGQDPVSVFVPSYEARYASSPAQGIDPDMAKRIALAFFKSRTEAPPVELSESQQRRKFEANDVIDRLKKYSPDLLATWERQALSEARKKLEALNEELNEADRTASIVKHFAEQNADLVGTFVNAAVDSFLSLPSSASQPLLRASVQLVLQGVDPSTYNPIADEIHMDTETDLLRPNGNRYGRPASEQDVSSLVASFCADLVQPERVTLSGCGTVYFDGMPIVRPDLLSEAARAVQQKPFMQTYTEYEIISSMGEKLAVATSKALKRWTEDELRKIGIVARRSKMLEWTNVNALAFHRSARRDEVLAGAVPVVDGRAAPRMRAFAIVMTDTQKDDGKALYFGEHQDIKLPSITRRGRQIELEVAVTVLPGGQGASMGEDVM